MRCELGEEDPERTQDTNITFLGLYVSVLDFYRLIFLFVGFYFCFPFYIYIYKKFKHDNIVYNMKVIVGELYISYANTVV